MSQDIATDIITDIVQDIVSGKGSDVMFGNVKTDEDKNVLTDEGGLILLE